MTRICSLFSLIPFCGCLAGTGSNSNTTPVLTVDVSGTWTITGRGERTGCAEALLNGDFSLDGMVPLQVRQTSSGQGTAVLTADPLNLVGVKFDFGGSVSESAVEFHTTETGRTEDGLDYTLTFVFSGEAEGTLISGDFTGPGPSSGCTASGTFEVVVSGQHLSADGAHSGDPLPPADPLSTDPGVAGDGHLLIPGDGFADQLGLSCDCRAASSDAGIWGAFGGLLWAVRRRRAPASR